MDGKLRAKKWNHKVQQEVPQHLTPNSILQHPFNWLLLEGSQATLACSLTQPHFSLLWESQSGEQIKNSPKAASVSQALASGLFYQALKPSSGKRQRQLWELLLCEFSAVFFLPWDGCFQFYNVSQILCVRITLKYWSNTDLVKWVSHKKRNHML